MALPVNIDELIHGKTVEWKRIEFKEGWNPEAIEESLVNAVYHRDYEDDSPVEVRVFSNRIEILSYPGPLPPLNKNNLNNKRVIARKYRNRRIGDFLKELHLTEGRGTGFPKIRNALQSNGSPAPVFETDDDRTYFLVVIKVHPSIEIKPKPEERGTPQVTPQVVSLLKAVKTERSRMELLDILSLKDREHFRKKYLLPAIEAGWIELTIPDKPKSRMQKYRITDKGRDVLNG